jgi:hypothetical protein
MREVCNSCAPFLTAETLFARSGPIRPAPDSTLRTRAQTPSVSMTCQILKSRARFRNLHSPESATFCSSLYPATRNISMLSPRVAAHRFLKARATSSTFSLLTKTEPLQNRFHPSFSRNPTTQGHKVWLSYQRTDWSEARPKYKRASFPLNNRQNAER